MAIFGLFKNRADKWQDWSVKVANNPKKAKPGFEISSEDDPNSSVFMNKLEKFAKQYIDQYDSDGDGKISYEEFEKYEEKQLRKNTDNIDEKTLEAAKQDLRILYENLNLNNDGDSKGKLDKGEVMNMFYTMSGSNGDVSADGSGAKVDGYISQYEYKNFAKSLSLGILTPERAKKQTDLINTAIDKANLPKEIAEQMKTDEQNSINNALNIQNFLKTNYSTRFKDYK